MTKRITADHVKLKRAYESAAANDGTRILIDRRRYAAEVHQHPEQLNTLRTLARQGPITLVFSAHDELHNDAVALRDFLLGRNAKKAEATYR